MESYYTAASASSGGAIAATLGAALQFFAASQFLLQETWPLDVHIKNESSFDFIVVGGGSAGCALAARLSEAAGVSVLLLEAGGDPPQEAIVPGFKDVMKRSSFDWNFTTVNDHYSGQAFRDGVQNQPRGKMLGGSGSLHDMVYSRGFPLDYEEWSTIVGDDWNWPNLLTYFKKTEHLTDERIKNDPELMKYHSVGGEIEVAGLNVSTFTTDVFLKAFNELGFKIVKDMTHPKIIGAGRFSHTIRNGRRDGSLTGLLNKAARRENLYVVKNAFVTKILIENNTAYGVQFVIDDDYFNVYANKEVILSAGTFNTAKLLLLSGIGPKEHLDDLGIPVVKELPVGENLHDHVMMLNYFKADNGTCDTDTATLYFEMIRYFYDATGYFSRTNSMGAYFSLKGSGSKVPEFAIYPSCVRIAGGVYDGCANILNFDDEICLKLQNENQNHELISLAVVLLKPKSRGTLRLRSSDPFDEPLLFSGTFNEPQDLDGYPDAIKLARSVINTTHFRRKNAEVIEFELDECDGLDELEKLKCEVRAMAMPAWHAVGTAAMGTVLDSRLNVVGVSNLRVADASVMPKVVRGNTNAPVVMIAEKAADFIKHDYKLR